MTSTESMAEAKKPKPVTISLDGENLDVPDREITPNEILTIAQLDPVTHYLVEIKGRHQTSFEGKGDVPIRVKEGEVFVSVSTGPTPTS